MQQYKQKFIAWSQKFIHSRFAEWFLGIFAFLESIIIPIPTDVMLISMVLLRRERWWRYTLIAIITSVLGGIAAYFIGFFFFEIVREPLFATLDLADDFAHIQAMFDKNTFVAMITAAFTFIPYKVVALAGGVFKVNLLSFIAASLVGRTLRFGVEAFLIYKFGQAMGDRIYRHFSFVVVGLLIIAIVLLLFL